MICNMNDFMLPVICKLMSPYSPSGLDSPRDAQKHNKVFYEVNTDFGIYVKIS